VGEDDNLGSECLGKHDGEVWRSVNVLTITQNCNRETHDLDHQSRRYRQSFRDQRRFGPKESRR
jgi:hypothetical protein